MQDKRLRRVAHHELVFRRANDRLREDWRRLGMDDDDHGLFLCECGDVSCKQPLRVTLVDYETVRAGQDVFVVVPGHEDAAVETVVNDVVSHSDAFNVVRKHPSPGAKA